MALITRRHCLLGLAGTLLPLTSATRLLAAGGSQSKPDNVVFAVYRDGAWLGQHSLRFTRNNAQLEVAIEIDLLVRLAFIPVYRYRHRSREVWADGRLLSLATETDDDGSLSTVQARAADGQLIVEGPEGRQALPETTLPTSYWDEAMMRQDRWLDTQTGKLVRSSVTALPEEPVTVAGQSRPAQPYRLVGDLDCTLWYSAGRWVKLDFAAPDGSTIAYAIESEAASG